MFSKRNETERSGTGKTRKDPERQRNDSGTTAERHGTTAERQRNDTLECRVVGGIQIVTKIIA